MKKRDLFSELMQGIAEMMAHCKGKITVHSNTLEGNPVLEIDLRERVDTQCSGRLGDKAGGEIPRQSEAARGRLIRWPPT